MLFFVIIQLIGAIVGWCIMIGSGFSVIIVNTFIIVGAGSVRVIIVFILFALNASFGRSSCAGIMLALMLCSYINNVCLEIVALRLYYYSGCYIYLNKQLNK